MWCLKYSTIQLSRCLQNAISSVFLHFHSLLPWIHAMFAGVCGPPEKLSLALVPHSYVLRMIVKLAYLVSIFKAVRVGPNFKINCSNLVGRPIGYSRARCLRTQGFYQRHEHQPCEDHIWLQECRQKAQCRPFQKRQLSNAWSVQTQHRGRWPGKEANYIQLQGV